jgi:hypothetical protein
VRGPEAVWWVWISAALVLPQLSCAPVPFRVTPGVVGVVVDAVSGDPLSEALVVVQFQGYYDEVLPDRQLLGHGEARTDALGRFRIERRLRSGLSAWPLFKTEARVVGVIREGYRCGGPEQVFQNELVEIALRPALDLADQRESCRPVPARRGEAKAYQEAWRALHPRPQAPTEPPEEDDRQLERLLEARSVFGFGENCEGPVSDLALAPGGRHAAFVVAGPEGAEIRLLELGGGGAGLDLPPVPASRIPPRRLAWAGPGELVLWEPASEADRAVSPSIFASGRIEVIWRDSTAPAAPAPDAPRMPLEPEDLNDEGDALWRGRSFSLRRTLDTNTGLGSDLLRVSAADGSRHTVALPGEACGPRGRFGRPHHRIASDTRTGLDLRFVDGGCHVVGVDLQTGLWSRLDSAAAPAVCRDRRRLPATHLRAALRGYSGEVEDEMARAGADTAAAYSLRIDAGGETRAETRDFSGAPLAVPVPPFPIATPLRRIDVSVVGASPRAPRAEAVPSARPQPL